MPSKKFAEDLRKVGMKGFFLTFDVFIAAIILMVAVSIMIRSMNENTITYYYSYKELSCVSDDVMTLLSMMKLSELNSSYISYLLQNTNLTEQDLNKSVLEGAVLLWAYGQQNIAADMLGRVINNILNSTTYGYEIKIVDSIGRQHVILSRGTPPKYTSLVATSSRLVSGYKENALPRGYVARAMVRFATSNETLVIPIEIEGSAHGSGNRLIVIKKFKLDFNTTAILNATLTLSIHSGISNISANDFRVDGVDLPLNTSNYFCVEEPYYGTYACYITFDVTNILRNNNSEWHTIEIQLVDQSYNAHFHPGSYLTITYNKTLAEHNLSTTVAKKIYFDYLYSEGSATNPGGVWAVMPIIIPKGAKVNNVTVHLRVNGVADTFSWIRWFYGLDPDTDVWVYFNNELIYTADNPSSNFDLYLDLTNYVRNSGNVTNVLYVSFDCYPSYDLFWAPNDIELYSDPENDPNGSSYIFVNYTIENFSKYRYGYMPVLVGKEFGGAIENPKTKDFYFYGHEVAEAYLYMAQLFSTTPSVYVKPEGQIEKEVYAPSLARVVPSSIYIDPSYFDFSVNNTITLEDVLGDGVNRSFLPRTTLNYLIMLPSMVPYGKVFDTPEEAIEDAKNRLEKLLAGYANIINITAYPKSTLPIGNIPFMYGPVLVTMEVWRV